MKSIWSTIKTSVACCHPCCCASPPDEAENTELQTLPQGTIICQPPTVPEPINYPDGLLSIGSDHEPSGSPVLDSLDMLWKNVPHPITGSTVGAQKKTERYRQTVALLDEFNSTYEVVKKIFEGLSHYSCHWYKVMRFYYRVRSFVNEDSDNYFRYAGKSNTAHDADFDGVKAAVDSFTEEWEKLQDLLATEEGNAERLIRLMTLDSYEQVDEAVPRDFV